MKGYNYFSIKMIDIENNVEMSKYLNYKTFIIWLIISFINWFILFFLLSVRSKNNEEYTKPLMNYKQKDENDDLIVLNE